MKSYTVDSFWKTFDKIPLGIQNAAKRKFQIWKENPFYPSLRFKCVNSKENIWSVTITTNYRALGVKSEDAILWYWIGKHDDYEKLLKN